MRSPRTLIERFAVERIGQASPELAAALEAAIETQERATAADDPQSFVEADRQFHRLLMVATENDILISFHDSLRDRQTRMGLAAISTDAARQQEIMTEHRALLDALRSGSPDASAILARHLEGTLAVLRTGRRLPS